MTAVVVVAIVAAIVAAIVVAVVAMYRRRGLVVSDAAAQPATPPDAPQPATTTQPDAQLATTPPDAQPATRPDAQPDAPQPATTPRQKPGQKPARKPMKKPELKPKAKAPRPAPVRAPAGAPVAAGDDVAPPVLANPGGRLVGIMYSTWFDDFPPYATKTQTEGLNAPPGGPALHWWGHPQFANGDWNQYKFAPGGKPNVPLITYHARLLVAAGVDFIAVDLTNGNTAGLKGLKAVCEVYARLKYHPKVVPWARTTADVAQLKRELYDAFPARVFLDYEGKKLLLVGDQAKEAIPTGGVYDAFTVRKMWGLTNDPNLWTFKQNLRTGDRYQPFMHNGKPEQMSVAVAVQSTYMSDPTSKRQGREGGAYMARQFELVKKFKPRVVVVTSWNEWLAIRGQGRSATSKDKSGHHFVDQFGPEFSADIEPSRELGTKYYDLLKAHIRAFKALPA